MKIREITEAPGQQMIVKKDDPNKTILHDPKTGTTTTIDKKKNPSARIQQDPKNPQKAMMTDPNAAATTATGSTKKAVVKPGTKVTITK